MFLETERVYLREINHQDTDNLFELDSDPEVMRYINHGVPSSREDVQAAVERSVKLLKKHNGRFGIWAAIEKSTDRFMGWFILRPAWSDPENTKRLEIGYRLRREYWGQGHATEISRLLLAKGFAEPEVEEIFAVAMRGNTASQGVMKKIGLVLIREGISEQHAGQDVYDVEYAMKRAQL